MNRFISVSERCEQWNRYLFLNNDDNEYGSSIGHMSAGNEIFYLVFPVLFIRMAFGKAPVRSKP